MPPDEDRAAGQVYSGMNRIAKRNELPVNYQSTRCPLPIPYIERHGGNGRRRLPVVNILKEGCSVAAGLQPHALEFCRHILRGEKISASSRSAALKKIVGEERHVGANAILSHSRQKIVGNNRRAGLRRSAERPQCRYACYDQPRSHFHEPLPSLSLSDTSVPSVRPTGIDCGSSAHKNSQGSSDHGRFAMSA
jgi:hypothetical protein